MLYASSFSGFYLPLMIVLWLLMLRAIGIELRSHVDAVLWRNFFDVVFSISSLLLAIFFGAALGNVIRGVPLNAEGYFFEPLWTTFTVTEHPGILDWYTVLTGVMAFATLTSHGALYVATKTEGDVSSRARRCASASWWAIVLLTFVGLIATLSIRPQLLENYKTSFAGAVFPTIVVASLAGMSFFRIKGNDRAAFVSSCGYIVGMLGGVAYGLYPNLLPASTDASYGLTINNSAAASYGLGIGLRWWVIGIAIALGYFVYLYRSFSGKVNLQRDG
jgi:cytochrome d ubiquinol oxidase subunit II